MKKMFKQYYDNDTDTSWIIFKGGTETRYKEFAPGVNVEFNQKNEVIGIEIQNVSRLYNFKSTTKEEVKDTYNFQSQKEYPEFASSSKNSINAFN